MKCRVYLSSIIFGGILSFSVYSQSPDRLSYQAVVRNGSGNVVASQSVGMRISILKGSATGTLVYVETQTRTTNASGLVTLEIGGGTTVTGTFASVNWGQGPYYIKTETDVAGGTNYQLSATTQLLSVPYALYSGDVPISKRGDTITIGNSRLIIPNSTLLTADGAPASLSSGLVAYYPFRGNPNDSSGNNNHGTILNASLSSDRFNVANSSYLIDGVNCSTPKGISLPCNISNTGQYSISIWYLSTDSSKQNQNIFNTSPHPYLAASYNYVGRGNATSGHVGNGTWLNAGPTGTITWPTFFLNNWHHLVVVKTLSEFKFYEDGLLKFTYAISPSFNTGQFTGIVVGASSINGGSNCYEVFKGKVDDVRIYNRSLSQDEISYLSKN